VPAIRGRFGPTAIPISTAALGRVGKDKLAKELGRRSVFGFSAAVRRLIEVNLISGPGFFFWFFFPPLLHAFNVLPFIYFMYSLSSSFLTGQRRRVSRAHAGQVKGGRHAAVGFAERSPRWSVSEKER